MQIIIPIYSKVYAICSKQKLSRHSLNKMQSISSLNKASGRITICIDIRITSYKIFKDVAGAQLKCRSSYIWYSVYDIA